MSYYISDYAVRLHELAFSDSWPFTTSLSLCRPHKISTPVTSSDHHSNSSLTTFTYFHYRKELFPASMCASACSLLYNVAKERIHLHSTDSESGCGRQFFPPLHMWENALELSKSVRIKYHGIDLWLKWSQGEEFFLIYLFSCVCVCEMCWSL